jgi:hypothetical protein
MEYNKLKEGDANVSNVKAGKDVQTISNSFE